jgi:hypothetical protein
MNNKRKQCQVFKNIKFAHSKKPIGAIMLQEHHLKADPDAAKEADKLAHDFRLLFFCNPIPQADHKGGTAIIIPYDSIELKGGETFHDAVDRIRGTLLKREHGRITAAHAIFEGKPYRLVSVYAPPDSVAATRPDFFKHALRPQLTDNTILGLDANCVWSMAVGTAAAAVKKWD